MTWYELVKTEPWLEAFAEMMWLAGRYGPLEDADYFITQNRIPYMIGPVSPVPVLRNLKAGMTALNHLRTVYKYARKLRWLRARIRPYRIHISPRHPFSKGDSDVNSIYLSTEQLAELQVLLQLDPGITPSMGMILETLRKAKSAKRPPINLTLSRAGKRSALVADAEGRAALATEQKQARRR